MRRTPLIVMGVLVGFLFLSFLTLIRQPPPNLWDDTVIAMAGETEFTLEKYLRDKRAIILVVFKPGNDSAEWVENITKQFMNMKLLSEIEGVGVIFLGVDGDYAWYREFLITTPHVFQRGILWIWTDKQSYFNYVQDEDGVTIYFYKRTETSFEEVRSFTNPDKEVLKRRIANFLREEVL